MELCSNHFWDFCQIQYLELFQTFQFVQFWQQDEGMYYRLSEWVFFHAGKKSSGKVQILLFVKAKSF